MRIECLPREDELCARLIPVAITAAERLEMDRRLAVLIFCLDDLEADDRVWLSFGEVVGPPTELRRVLTVYLHQDHLLRDRPSAWATSPVAMDWEQGPSPKDVPVELNDVSRPKMERFLYHHLLGRWDFNRFLLRIRFANIYQYSFQILRRYFDIFQIHQYIFNIFSS